MGNQDVTDSKIPRGLGIITNEHIFRIIDKIHKRLDKLESEEYCKVESPSKIPNIMENKKKKKKVKDK